MKKAPKALTPVGSFFLLIHSYHSKKPTFRQLLIVDIISCYS